MENQIEAYRGVVFRLASTLFVVVLKGNHSKATSFGGSSIWRPTRASTHPHELQSTNLVSPRSIWLDSSLDRVHGSRRGRFRSRNLYESLLACRGFCNHVVRGLQKALLHVAWMLGLSLFAN